MEGVILGMVGPFWFFEGGGRSFRCDGCVGLAWDMEHCASLPCFLGFVDGCVVGIYEEWR